MIRRAARTLRVLAHADRIKMIEMLIGERLSVGALAELVNLPAAAVSQHLNMMRAHGIVEAQREGRMVFYKVVSPQALYLIECLRNHRNEL